MLVMIVRVEGGTSTLAPRDGALSRVLDTQCTRENKASRRYILHQAFLGHTRRTIRLDLQPKLNHCACLCTSLSLPSGNQRPESRSIDQDVVAQSAHEGPDT